MGIFAILLSIAILGAALYYHHQKKERLRSEGKIIDRSSYFYKEGEEFIVLVADKTIVTQKIRGLNYGEMKISMRADENRQIFSFSGVYFTAQLLLKEIQNEKSVYDFSFTSWKESNGAVLDYYSMNMLITAIEKAFLSIDPNTQIRTWKVDFKTKTSIF